MLKLIVILLVALSFETVGIMSLKKGLTSLEGPKNYRPSEIVTLVSRAATNKNILVGVLFEAIFFAGLLMMMKMGEVSLVWPLTSLTFVFSTLAAKFFLHENVSLIRWAGVVLIVCGAGFITYSEKERERELRAISVTSVQQPTL